jgi:hypothetical protein
MYLLFLWILIKIELSRQIFEKCPNVKFHENPSNGSQAVPCGRTDMKKVTDPIRNFAKASKNSLVHTNLFWQKKKEQNVTCQISLYQKCTIYKTELSEREKVQLHPPPHPPLPQPDTITNWKSEPWSITTRAAFGGTWFRFRLFDDAFSLPSVFIPKIHDYKKWVSRIRKVTPLA